MLKMAFCNTQSLRNKTLLVKDFIAEHEIDLFCIAESWLKWNDQVEIGELENNKSRLLMEPRKNRPGGGVACLASEGLSIESEGTVSAIHSFEYLITKLKVKTRTY